MVKTPELIRNAQVQQRNLLEHEILLLLDAYGLPVPEFRVLPFGEKPSSEFLAAFSYPLVLKVISRDIVHKTEVGGVRLNVCDESELRAAIVEMAGSIEKQLPGTEIEGWLIRSFIPSGTELIAGSIVDAQFGPVVMIGIGGIYTEVFRDTSFRMIPLSSIDAEEMIEDLRTQSLLDGVRGQPAVDRDQLADLLIKLSGLIADHPEIEECDINPIICSQSGILVADARVKLRGR